MWLSMLTLLMLGAPDGPPRLLLERSAEAQGCPDGEALDALVSARLGKAAFSSEGARAVHIRMERDAASARAVIELKELDGTVVGTRTLTTQEAGCAQLRDVLVVTLTIMLDQFAQLPPPVPVTTPPEPPPPVVVPKAPVKVPPRPRPTPVAQAPVVKERRWWALELRSGVTANAGMLPAPAPGVVVGAALKVWRWSVGLELQGVAPALRLQGGRWWTAGGAVAAATACAEVWWFGGCSVVAAGGVVQGITGPGRNGPFTTPQLGGGGRLYVDLPLISALALRWSVDVLAAFNQTRVLLDGHQAWRTPLLTGQGGVWVRWLL